MKYFIAFLAIAITAVTLAGDYLEKKDAALIAKLHGITDVQIKWTEGGSQNYTKHYAHYKRNGIQCANVFYIDDNGAKAQPWEICAN